MRPQELIRVLAADGWFEVKHSGNHVHFRHTTKQGLVIVPFHSGKDLGKLTYTILKQAGLR